MRKDDALPHFATGDGLTVDFTPDKLDVFHHSATRPFRTVATRSWRAPAGQRCAGCEPCENPAYLYSVYKAKQVNAIVVEIAYRGTDTCWEPGNQLHLITW